MLDLEKFVNVVTESYSIKFRYLISRFGMLISFVLTVVSLIIYIKNQFDLSNITLCFISFNVMFG